MSVFGPDGREWTISRRPASSGVMPAMLRGGGYLVEATSANETRRWTAASRRVAIALVEQLALALRTGAASPPGELPSSSDHTERDEVS